MTTAERSNDPALLKVAGKEAVVSYIIEPSQLLPVDRGKPRIEPLVRITESLDQTSII